MADRIKERLDTNAVEGGAVDGGHALALEGHTAEGGAQRSG